MTDVSKYWSVIPVDITLDASTSPNICIGYSGATLMGSIMHIQVTRMIDDVIKDMVTKYLIRHFPVKRLKDDRTNRFKRGILVLDGVIQKKSFF